MVEGMLEVIVRSAVSLNKELSNIGTFSLGGFEALII
jgi:hypothetical protein